MLMMFRVRTYWKGLGAIFPAVLPFLLISCAAPVPVARVQEPAAPGREDAAGTVITLAAIGDIMTHSSAHAAARRTRDGYGVLFDRVRRDLEGADLTFANLETPVDDRSGAAGYPRFNAGPGLIKAVRSAGIDVVSVANNHIMDRGTRGLERTLSNIEKAGLLFVGAGRTKQETAAVRRVSVRTVGFAFLAYTYTTNERAPGAGDSQPGVNFLRKGDLQGLARAAEQVRAARKDADVVVVSLHWGEEYHTAPSSWQRLAAVRLVEAGADVILGHHPHVLQPIELIAVSGGRKGLVAYSLGNFVSGQHPGFPAGKKDRKRLLRGDGIVLLVRISRPAEGGALTLQAEPVPLCMIRERVGTVSVDRPVNIRREQTVLNGKHERSTDEDRYSRFLAEREERIRAQITPVRR